jgi:hypothetical protein
MAKITKREIREALDNIPIDTLLLPKATEKKFTPKQREFAKRVALGKPKSQAYRESHNTKMKPNAVASTAHALSKRADIQLLISAYEDAIEASKYRTPAQLRELVIHQLTLTAVSNEVSVRDRLSALKMLGTVSEVGAFTERKESLVIHESSKVKQQLLDQLKTIVGGDIREVKQSDDEGEELLAKLAEGRANKTVEGESHPHPIPPNLLDSSGNTMHNNPLTESPEEVTEPLTESPSEFLTARVDSEGEGVVENSEVSEDVDYREGPPSEVGSPDKREG